MKKIYEAIDPNQEKEKLIDEDNQVRALLGSSEVGINDLWIVTRLPEVPSEGKVENNRWALNGIEMDSSGKNDILVIDSLAFHVADGFRKVGVNDTDFGNEITLSSKAIILMPKEDYIKRGLKLNTRRPLRKLPIRLYEGKEDLALKMLFKDLKAVHLDILNGEYIKTPETKDFINSLKRQIDVTNKMPKEDDVRPKTINRKRRGYRSISEKPQIEAPIEDQRGNYRIITGVTTDTEGDVYLGDGFTASTDIGKVRRNQEDAVLLIRDKNNPDFKMMVVADGMGGHKSGEIASNEIVERLKDWFLNLSDEQKACYETSVENLKEDLLRQIKEEIIPAVKEKTFEEGGSTLVCAIIGKNDTMVTNVGDSRAYIAKGGKLKQISREDTLTQKKIEEGKLPSKEIARFDVESNIITKSIGKDDGDTFEPYVTVIPNESYDILLLVSDGVTDCLSDEDMIAICINTDKEKLARLMVEAAIRHDSILKKQYRRDGLRNYISGGPDNATCAAFAKENRQTKPDQDEDFEI